MKCLDFGDNPNCLGEADPVFTMGFSDIGEPPIYWCAYCGPIMKKIEDAITAMAKKDPDFNDKFEAALDAAEADRKLKANSTI